MKRISISAVFVVLVGCAKVLVPAERTAIFTEENAEELVSLSWEPLHGIAGFWTPEEKDLRGIEAGVQAFYAKNWEAIRGDEEVRMPEWSQYYRQVCGVLRGGERYIFISYARADFLFSPHAVKERQEDMNRVGQMYDPYWWKKTPIEVCDGGWSFFRVLYDTKRREFVWYDENPY